MKEGIHPKSEPTTIKCACGHVNETLSTNDNLLSLLESRNWLIPADVLTDLRNVLVWINKFILK